MSDLWDMACTFVEWNTGAFKDEMVAMSWVPCLPIKVADSTTMGQRHCIAVWLSKIQAQKSLTLRWCLLLGGSSDIATTIFAQKGGQHYDYGYLPLLSHWIVYDATPKIVDAPLTLIFWRWLRYGCCLFCPYRQSILPWWINAVTQPSHYQRCKTKYGDSPLMLIAPMGKRACLLPFYIQSRPVTLLWIDVTMQPVDWRKDLSKIVETPLTFTLETYQQSFGGESFCLNAIPSLFTASI
jgi:hypothetical protein